MAGSNCLAKVTVNETGTSIYPGDYINNPPAKKFGAPSPGPVMLHCIFQQQDGKSVELGVIVGDKPSLVKVSPKEISDLDWDSKDATEDKIAELLTKFLEAKGGITEESLDQQAGQKDGSEDEEKPKPMKTRGRKRDRDTASASGKTESGSPPLASSTPGKVKVAAKKSAGSASAAKRQKTEEKDESESAGYGPDLDSVRSELHRTELKMATLSAQLHHAQSALVDRTKERDRAQSESSSLRERIANETAALRKQHAEALASLAAEASDLRIQLAVPSTDLAASNKRLEMYSSFGAACTSLEKSFCSLDSQFTTLASAQTTLAARNDPLVKELDKVHQECRDWRAKAELVAERQPAAPAPAPPTGQVPPVHGRYGDAGDARGVSTDVLTRSLVLHLLEPSLTLGWGWHVGVAVVDLFGK